MGASIHTLRLAYRNLFRNTRRSILTALLIAFSLTALILTDAIARGMLHLMIDNVTLTFAGEAQIHHPKFRENYAVDFYMDDVDQLMDFLAEDVSIAAYSNRVMSGGMISSTYNVSAGIIYGLDAERERGVSKLAAGIIEGQYLTDKANEIVIGKPMAALLEAHIGDRIVLTLAEAHTGALAQALFRVAGIFELGIREMDKRMVFIHIDRAGEILALKSTQSHEVAIRFVDAESATLASRQFFNRLDASKYLAEDWLSINPEIASVIEMTGYTSLIVGLVLFLLTGLGVINSMFMSIYERIYEFAVIKAMGTRPLSLAWLIMTEAFLIALLSSALGALLGYAIGSYTAIYGIPVGDTEVSGIAIKSNILTIFNSRQFVEFPVYITLLTLAAAIYPAIFAAKITPSAALQKTL